MIERIVRDQWGRVLSVLVARLGNLELAEDVLQDALLIALQRWPRDGQPDNPAAWLLQTARRKAIDRLRRDAVFRRKQVELTVLAELEAMPDDCENDVGEDQSEAVPDERLSLIFTCCHPALAEPAQIALTLKTLGGLSTAEIARAFVVSETAMAQRLVRAKRKIRQAGIPYRVPPPDLWHERLVPVLAVIYLIFNEGWQRSAGPELGSADLTQEAIRLARIMTTLAPQEPEVLGLLALMTLHDARRSARVRSNGQMAALSEQDRTRWNRAQIEAGIGILQQAMHLGRPGVYQLQAAISAVHCRAPDYASTDWRQIIVLYERLYELQPSPVVRLNQAVATAEVDGPEAALDAVRQLEAAGDLDGYQPLQATLAHLLECCGRFDEAMVAYGRAIELSGNEVEREFLQRKRRRVSSVL